MRKIEQISVSEADGERPERLIHDRNTPQKVRRIMLPASNGLTVTAIAVAAGEMQDCRDDPIRKMRCRGLASASGFHTLEPRRI
jgi:hypothetical protein